MNKNLKNYIICWVILVALFNIICFVTPTEVGNLEKFGGAFWAGYGFIMGSFLLHLVYAVFALSEQNRQKRVLSMPLTIISMIELLIMVLVGTLCMVIPNVPNWLGVVLCFTVLALSVIFLVSAKTVGENVQAANEVMNENSQKMRAMTAQAQELISCAKTEENRQIARKVYEALRYSDPVSHAATVPDEEKIKSLLSELTEAMRKDDSAEETEEKTEELLRLIEKRNNICKEAKRQLQ